MSTKSSLWWTRECHLYTDLIDDFPGPHAYLRIDNDLVKQIQICRTPSGLSVTIRLPPEVFPVLRPDIAKSLRQRGKPIDWSRLDKFLAKRRRSRPAARSTSNGGPRPRRSR